MQVQQAHLHIRTLDDNGKEIDTVIILDNVSVSMMTHKSFDPVYTVGSSEPQHFVKSKGHQPAVTVEGVGYVFHQGPAQQEQVLSHPQQSVIPEEDNEFSRFNIDFDEEE